MMRHFYIIIFSTLLLCSCSDQYRIAGNTSVPMLDGRMLYLKIQSNNNIRNLDSCEVVHGQFNFMGMMDSIVMAELYMDNESVMPLVLENGNLTIRINSGSQQVLGGSLNEKLYRFIEKKSQLDNDLLELSNKEVRYIMNGEYNAKRREKIRRESQKCEQKIERLETAFISENYDNILGPEVFMLICSRYRYPIMTEQIRQIIKNAPKKFIMHPFVHNYVRTARLNMLRIKNTPRSLSPSKRSLNCLNH